MKSTPTASNQRKLTPLARRVAVTTEAAHDVAAKPAIDPDASTRRKMFGLIGLIAVMTSTSALLLALRTGPLAPRAARVLIATDRPDEMNAVFLTETPVSATRWKYIFIHHSQTSSGSAALFSAESADSSGMADHFVIGNGDGCDDGAVEYGLRWNQQLPAGRSPGIERMDNNCISICLVGDFDRAVPTPMQMRSLHQIVEALQHRLNIDRDHVWTVDAKESPAGTGQYFPRDPFRDQLAP